jgi:hypothetical protein
MIQMLERGNDLPFEIPGQCQTCPEVNACLETWGKINFLKDLVIAEAVKDDPNPDNIPDTLYEMYAKYLEATGTPQSNEGEEQTRKALLTMMAGGSYEWLQTWQGESEESMRFLLEQCTAEGVVEFITPADDGPAVVTVCRVALQSVDSEATEVTATIRLQDPTL